MELNDMIAGTPCRSWETAEMRDVIIACDFSSAEETLAFLNRFGEDRPFVKIGMELYYAAGPDIVRQLKARGHRVFLDLKADIVNLHAAGARAMMEAALEGLTRPDGSRPLLIAVTQLTSTDQERMEKELLISRPLDEVVIAYAQNAAAAGLDGVVCSPLEAGKVHAACGERFLTVTPGVRFADGEKGDQKRVTTPAQARELGSDYIVVGRPITAADDPVAAWDRCRREFMYITP